MDNKTKIYLEEQIKLFQDKVDYNNKHGWESNTRNSEEVKDDIRSILWDRYDYSQSEE